MTSSEQIPEELLWQDDGHASDLAVTALADGQSSIVASNVRLHVSACGYCTSRMGEAALASLDVDSALQVLSTSPASSPISVRIGRLPFAWIGGALAVAVLGLIPSVVSPSFSPREYWLATVRFLPVVVRALPVLWDSLGAEYGRFLPIASLLSAVSLVMVGVVLARAVPRQVSTVGGLR